MSRLINLKKQGFSLIELIVVMAVIAILVLLATPWFMNYVMDSRTTNITNDVKVAEGLVEEYLVHANALPTDWNVATDINSSTIYDTDGELSGELTGTYYIIKGDVLNKIGSKLDGDFLTNESGKVYYKKDSSIGSIPSEVPEEAKISATPIGAGTEGDPYQIWFLENLAYIDTDDNTRAAYYLMMRDLDFDIEDHYLYPEVNKDLWTLNEGWVPLGDDYFTGVLDGGNHNLSNLYINRLSDDQGLFSYTYGAIIRDINLLNADVTAYSYTGTLIAFTMNQTFVMNVSASGTVNGESSVGGLVGYTYNTTIANSEFTGNVTGEQVVGGLIGSILNDYADRDSILNSNSKGSVSGLSRIGGLVGYLENGNIYYSFSTSSINGSGANIGGLAGLSESSRIIESFATGAVNAPSAYAVGGLAGIAYGVIIENSFASGDVVGDNSVGGLIGYYYDSIHSLSETKITNTYAIGDVVGSSYVSGFIGDWDYDVLGNITNSYYHTTYENDAGTMVSETDLQNMGTFSGWDFSNIWIMESSPSLRAKDEQAIITISDGFVFNKSSKTILSYNGKLTEIVIPSSIEGVPVERIGGNAFGDLYYGDITSVDIPSGITYIGNSAFGGNLISSITIPNTVVTIENDAFYGNKLTTVTIPSSTTYIGQYAFSNNLLTPGSVTINNIADNVFIGYRAFYKHPSNMVPIFNP